MCHCVEEKTHLKLSVCFIAEKHKLSATMMRMSCRRFIECVARAWVSVWSGYMLVDTLTVKLNETNDDEEGSNWYSEYCDCT